MVVEFRRRILLLLDDVLGCLRDSIPKLTRSSLHRWLERHGISRLPENPDQASKRGAGARSRADVQDYRHPVTGSGAAGGDRFGDAGHAVEDLDGDGGLALLDIG